MTEGGMTAGTGHRTPTQGAVSESGQDGAGSATNNPADDDDDDAGMDADDSPTADGNSADDGSDSTDNPTPTRGCKRGMAYGYHSAADLDALSGAVGWWYNWSPRPEEGIADVYANLGLEFAPMVWGGEFDAAAIEAAVPSDATALLGFNEPNFFAQSNLSAEQAAMLWPQLEGIADSHDLTLVSPAVNFCGGGCWDEDPFSYLDDFLAACEGCRVDAIAAHWYACDGPALLWYLGELEQYGLPIWLTEFSCGDGADLSVPVQLAYMADALEILEENPNVERYSWFSGRTDAIPNVDLLDGDGQLTELGELYVSAPASTECRR